jgi:hypothetical protein
MNASIQPRFILAPFLLISLYGNTQQVKKEKSLILSAGPATHFSGDIRGVMIQTEYSQQLSKNWTWYAGTGYSLHDEPGIPVTYTLNSTTIDATKKETTGGIQLTSHIGYGFLRQPAHRAGIKTGVLARYQSTSSTGGVGILYPAGTGLPFPVYELENRLPQRTVAAGISGQLYYTYSLTEKLGLGIIAGYQFDSNGDNISQLCLSLTRFFK